MITYATPTALRSSTLRFAPLLLLLAVTSLPAIAAPAVATPPTAIPKTGKWRSTLYPANWTPSGRFDQDELIQDFSYAGYHQNDIPLPKIKGPIFNLHGWIITD